MVRVLRVDRDGDDVLRVDGAQLPKRELVEVERPLPLPSTFVLTWVVAEARARQDPVDSGADEEISVGRGRDGQDVPRAIGRCLPRHAAVGAHGEAARDGAGEDAIRRRRVDREGEHHAGVWRTDPRERRAGVGALEDAVAVHARVDDVRTRRVDSEGPDDGLDRKGSPRSPAVDALERSHIPASGVEDAFVERIDGDGPDRRVRDPGVGLRPAGAPVDGFHDRGIAPDSIAGVPDPGVEWIDGHEDDVRSDLRGRNPRRAAVQRAEDPAASGHGDHDVRVRGIHGDRGHGLGGAREAVVDGGERRAAVAALQDAAAKSADVDRSRAWVDRHRTLDRGNGRADARPSRCGRRRGKEEEANEEPPCAE